MHICFALDLKIREKTAYQIVACPTVKIKLVNLDITQRELVKRETVEKTYNSDAF